MLYSDGKGKYEKAYNFLFKKMVPPSGKASNPLGEALRLVSRVYYRLSNDGDSYGDCIEYGMVPYFAGNEFPFVKEYAALGRELDSHLSSSSGYDKAVDLVLLHIMLSLSSESNIYNPETIYDPFYPADNFEYQTFTLPAGYQTLDGENTLKFIRTRKTTSDFDRSNFR